MKRTNSLLICLLLSIGLCAQSLGRHAANSGGGDALSGGFYYSYSIGEAIIGTGSNGSITITRGVQQPEQAGGLPVELLSFTGELKAGTAHLRWITNLEIQSAHFVVERSIDGLVYENIGQVQAAGYADSPTSYTFDDDQAGSMGLSVLYYRLRQFDLDGEFSISPTVQLNLSGEAYSLSSLFPNPASTEAFLRYQTKESAQALFTLTTVNGQVIYSERLTEASGIHAIPVSNLAEGTYFVTYSSDDYRKTHRLIVTH